MKEKKQAHFRHTKNAFTENRTTIFPNLILNAKI